MERDDARFVTFFEELIGDRLVTSTYVVTETVRRIVKSKYDQFVGPSGERGIDLALHVLKVWLVENEVVVINVPDQVFESAKQSLEEQRHVQCDLTLGGHFKTGHSWTPQNRPPRGSARDQV
jgi:hypothetical protein